MNTIPYGRTQRISFASALAFVLAFFAIQVRAEPIANFTSTLPTGSATQKGRLSRNGLAQDWVGSEAYPGVINTTTSYYYETFSFNSSLFANAPYVEISIFEPISSPNLFFSAYSSSYNPLAPAANWLGDEGASGDYFGYDAVFFDVVLPTNSNLILVVNNTSGTAGLNLSFNAVVNGYADTFYDDPLPTPEPSTIVTVGTGLFGLAGAARRRFALKG